MSEAGPSGIDKQDLDLAKRTFDSETSTPTVKANIIVRRRRRPTRHVAQDLLFSVTFSQSQAGNIPVLTCLLGVYEIILNLVHKLKTYFDDKRQRLCFFSASVDKMVSPIHSGGRDLHNEPEEEITKAILEPLFAYLTSNSEVDLNAGLEIKASVLSLDHTAEYDEKRKKRPLKRPPPQGHLLGHRGASLKDITHYSGSRYGYIIIPRGIPAQADLFDNRCLPVAFSIGLMITQAANAGEKPVKKLLKDLRSLNQLSKASQKKKNSMGQKIWNVTQAALDSICTTSNGPHSYSVLDDLCRKNKIQCIVFSGLLAEPTYFFPLDQMEARPDRPCIFLQEVVSLNPTAKTQFHINLIIRPEMVYPNKFICQLCFQVVSKCSRHQYCAKRVSCFYCGRKQLRQGDWYDALMVKKFCPALLEDHPAVEYLDEPCPTCQEKIGTKCCFKKHKQNCNGKTRCKKCSKIIVAYRGEKLEEKVANHQCGLRKCLVCFEDINLEEARTHCCKLAPITFPRGYNQQGFVDLETYEEEDHQLRDFVLYFAYESQIAGLFNGIAFCHDGFIHPYASVIEKNIFKYDYLPKTIGNLIDPASGMLKPNKKKRKKKKMNVEEIEDDLENYHWDLDSYIRETQHDHRAILQDYNAYFLNLKKYRCLVPPDMRARPVFKFLCFILNDQHRSRCISAHYGGRFDVIVILECLLVMGITPKVLAQGQGVLQLHIVEYDIIFNDSFRFLPQKLESLPKRFQLEEFKGHFAYSLNPPKNWNRVRKNPPELSAFISEKDSEEKRAEKTKWWTEVKSKMPYFDFNSDCILYCKQDVIVLMASCLKFFTQTFEFGQQMIQRFGVSPAFREGLHQPHFHPFSKASCTLGSYS